MKKKENNNVQDHLSKLLEVALLQIAEPSITNRLLEHPLTLSVPNNEAYGDYATNLAMVLAKELKQPPLKIAESLVKKIPPNIDWLKKIEIVKPGFINFFLTDEALRNILPRIISQKEAYGQSKRGKGRKVLLEFVSANPTGPLHIGHGRGAALGGALTNLFKAAGYEVTCEYYLNDLGTQMETLGRSIQARFKEIQGEDQTFPENGYKGEYIKDLAGELSQHLAAEGQAETALDLPFFSRYGRQAILKQIQEDLDNFGIHFDSWFSEEGLVRQGKVKTLIDKMQTQGLLYQAEGALWFNSQAFGDEKDRVVIRASGALTYFASDMAYHLDKFDRGFQTLINIWGADHHGYVPRLKASLQSLGFNPNDLTIILVQLVTLIRGGKPVAMSTRAGEFITLKEVLEEVGTDAARYIFLTRRSDSPLDFDLDLAKKQSSENPVYYVQYAHARVCSVLAMAESQGISLKELDTGCLQRLNLPEERKLCKLLMDYPEEVNQAALKLEPHRLPFFLGELAAQFHFYYNHHRIIQEDQELSRARLALSQAIGTVIKNALTLLGVSAPEKMIRNYEASTV